MILVIFLSFGFVVFNFLLNFSRDTGSFLSFIRWSSSFSFPGGPESLRAELGLTNADDFHYLNQGCTRYFTSASSASKLKKDQLSDDMKSSGGLTDIQLDDVSDFAKTDAGKWNNVTQVFGVKTTLLTKL